VAATLLLVAAAAPAANAWTQESISDSVTNGACSPCVRYTPLSVQQYHYSTTFNANFKPYFATAVSNWTSQPYKVPSWYESTGGLTVAAALLASNLCGQSTIAWNSSSLIQAGSSNVRYNQNKVFSSDPSQSSSNVCNIQWTMAHEFGHSGIGMGHSGVAGSLMVPSDDGKAAPQQDEFNGMNAIYGHV
jgi:hypothetical protein